MDFLSRSLAHPVFHCPRFEHVSADRPSRSLRGMVLLGVPRGSSFFVSFVSFVVNLIVRLKTL